MQQNKTQVEQNSRDDPHARCLPDTFLRLSGLPHMQKFIQTPGLLVMLYEMNANYRQVLPTDDRCPMIPILRGRDIRSASGTATLVVDSIGFRDGQWLDMSGTPLTDAAKVRERIRRPDFGHLEVEITVDDPKAYTSRGR